MRIAYATVGEGPPILKAANWLSHLEHDWDSPIWRHLLAEFARDHTFIRYDERGNGLSDWDCADLSFNAWVDDLESVVAAAKLDRFPLLGISQGGSVAIAYAVRHPEKVSHLILYGAYARGWAQRDSPEEIEQRQAQLTLVRLGWGKDNPAFRQLWTSLYAPDATQEQAQSFNDLQRVSTSAENAVKLLTEMGNIDVVDLLPQVQVPTLVLHCRDEAGVPFEEGRTLASMIPGARFVPLEGRNHLLLEGAPSWGKFVKEIRRFIGSETTSAVTESSGSAAKPAPNLHRTDLPDRYSIISFLGVGGMGEVYLAEDTKLGRKVAIKTLPAEFTNDKERLRRFNHEARAASALNHPNLLTIHEIGSEAGAHFIAAEYIDGETLRVMLKRGRLKIDEALDIGQQAAFALTAAHGAGIVHRDIKPENIMVRKDGIVKVLDFGLAKLLEDHARDMVDHEADTRALVLTDPGRVLGTPQYMSPEQARGMDLDARTDIWSLGVVLYEMIAGRAPFGGETRSHTVVSILETEPPPLTEFAPNVPPELQRIVRKALTKDRESRYQTARDLMIDLKSLRRDLDIQSEMKRSAPPGVSHPVSTDVNHDTEIASPVTHAAIGARTTETRETAKLFTARRVTLIASAALIVGLLILFAAKFYPGWGRASIDSLAVLPFVNVGNDTSTEYLSDGVTESLIDSLSQLPNVAVKSRNSVFRFKSRDIDPQAAGKELGVQAVLTGRVTRNGDGLVLSLELIDVRNNNHIWGNQYNRRISDLVTIQEEIVKEISDRLVHLTGEQQKKLTRHYSENTEAYELYLRGRYYWNKRTAEGIRKSIDYYEQAIAKDPNYALAYAGMADSYIVPAAVLPPDLKYPKAKWAAEKAISLDPMLADPRSARARAIFEYDRNPAEAEKEFQRAIDVNPNYPTAHQYYALFLVNMGRGDEALREARKAVSLDPLSLSINSTLGFVLLYSGRPDESIAQFNKVLEMDPNFANAHDGLETAYLAKHMWDAAVREKLAEIALTDVALSGDTRDMLEPLKAAFAAAGVRGFWQKRIELLLIRSKQTYIPPATIAGQYALLGEKDKAFELLENAYRQRARLSNIKVSPEFDSLRSDPRFVELLKRVGLPN